jgi:hypothetical protein
MMNGKLWVIRHQNFVNGDREKCDEFYRKFAEEKRMADINVGTQVGLGKTFMNAILENIPTIIRNNGVSSLKDALKDKPALVVASGPSLDGEAESLKKMQGKVFMLACDTALPFLLRHDIIPDVVCGIDPLADNNALFRDPRCRDIPLVCMAQYTPKVAKTYPGRKYFSAMPGNQIFHWLQWYWDEKGSVECFGGSVSHFAFAIADHMGASTIALIGHDFSFKSKWYCGDTSQILHDEMGLEIPDETKGAIREKNVRGEDVYTKPTLLSFRTSLQSKIACFDRKVINLTTDGLPIKGAVDMTPEAFIADYCREPHGCDISGLRSTNGYQLGELIKAVTLGRNIFRTINTYSLRIIGYIHEAKRMRAEGDDKGARRFLRRIERMRHFTMHPLLEIISGYHTMLEIYLRRQDIQDIDKLEDPWERREAQMERGLNYYGELSEAITLLLARLDALLRDLKAMRKKDGVSRPVRLAAEG